MTPDPSTSSQPDSDASLNNTSAGISPISSVRPSSQIVPSVKVKDTISARPIAHVSREMDSTRDLVNRHLGARLPFDEVVPPLFAANGMQKQPARQNQLPSQATQIQPTNKDAQLQVDLQTPQPRPRIPRATRLRELQVIQEGPEPSADSQRTEKPQPNLKYETNREPTEANLICQLRDTIVNLDFVEAEWRKKTKQVIDRLNTDRLSVTKQKDEWTNQKRIEEERMKREWKAIEREKKSLRKGEAERENDIQQQFDEQKKLISKLQQQLADFRIKDGKREKAMDGQKKDIEKEKTAKERLERRVHALQKEIATMRGKAATDRANAEAEARANERRTRRPGLLRAQNRPSTSTGVKEFSSDNDQRCEKEKCVTWADDRKSRVLSERGYGMFGHFDLYKSKNFEWTKLTDRQCGCQFYEYSNGDTRWWNRNRSVEVYYYANFGSTQIDLPSGMRVIQFIDKQIEIHRPSGESTLVLPNGKRIETMLRADGTFYAQIFEPKSSGFHWVVDGTKKERRRNMCNEWKRNGEFIRMFDDHMEWLDHLNGVAIWFSDGNCKVSLDTLGLRITLLAEQDSGGVKHIQFLPDGKIKESCVSWGSAVRRMIRAGDDGALNHFNVNLRNHTLPLL